MRGLIARAGNIVCMPRAEWPIVAAERRGIAELYLRYVVVVAALPLIAELIGTLPQHPPLGEAAAATLTSYLMALVGVALLGLASSGLAGWFGGTADLGQGFKLAAFGLTPAWLGGVFLLVPVVGSLLALAGTIYGIYVYYLGVGPLMRVPPRRRLPYAAAAIAAAIAAAALVQLAVALATGHLAFIMVHRPV